jgi:glutathione S-transferase
MPQGETEGERMAKPIIFGATYSVYTRIVRLALIEKDVAYDLVDVDIFAAQGPPADYRRRNPFDRIPAIEHDGFCLYESGAINRYIDEAFPGSPLQPTNLRARARMNQIMGILDSYAYRSMVWDVFVERIRMPARGQAPDEQRIAAGMARAETCLNALEEFMVGGAFLAGDRVTLADLHAAPMITLFRLAPEGNALLARWPGLRCWSDMMATRPSMASTRAPIEC